MILDQLENWSLYFKRESRIGRAFHFLTREFDPDSPEGRIDIEGDGIFALPQSYQTRPTEQARFEAHRQYIDIQLVLSGAEGMGWAFAGDLKISEEYDRDRDVLFFESPGNFTRLEVFPRSFALFYPSDAHAPGLALPGWEKVKKVVVKIRMS